VTRRSFAVEVEARVEGALLDPLARADVRTHCEAAFELR
jgi:hypothetical protein